ncbi:probable methyltransferase-like protein 24 isoform X1 [Eriocheir sinensis]|uniref:probable methyltransferase-like protein 24 isoform X1 n=1 Tax=Eriocheir sinensis TaxID=95602 RepID=UPI0021C94453|nr:probable methyltransferase-like protein 24 isoform X1 [Eriocheir sinensis]XP_050707415.1 probable methyltransferase-like protein 24 isoform X1 [Eriocheir sinensis]XP_050707416.1 probable methyltransferase-like protein 24 isoform X1 [Eriocheir sinensis]XP_050707417.1 probable methyltransferase-like protein 24 isoform X1 [Eriocheir sinensis]
MLAGHGRGMRGVWFAVGVVTGLFCSCGLFLYTTTTSPHLTAHSIPLLAEDTVWGEEPRPPRDDEDWGKINCTVPERRNMDDFYDYIDRRELQCHKPVMSGGYILTGTTLLMGEKWVCMDNRFNITPGRCLALSFGIADDFSFDDDMDKRFNCTVHSFDPTIRTPTHRRSANVMFHNLGIANSDREQNNMTMARYTTILQKLQLERSVIDYLKIDVEGFEVEFFSDVIRNTPNLLKNVKQIGMEIHAQTRVPLRRELLWMYFGFLRCYGFKVMFSEINPVKRLRFEVRGQERSSCYEVVWAREKQW